MKRPVYVYLAGPILGCTEHEAKTWREWFAELIKPLVAISPLRCEPIRDRVRYTMTDDRDPCFGTAQAIFSKNFLDVQRCDVAVIHFPFVPPERERSAGTIAELAWCYALRKPTILVSNDPFILGHPVISSMPNWSLKSFEEAAHLLHGIFDDYVEI